MKKRILSVLLSVGLLLGTLPTAFAASDIDGHWAKGYITYLDQEGVINPSATTGKYEPDRQMTRAEFMRYINRAFHFTETAAISYTDVKTTAWYYETVQIAAKYGYINGTGNNKMSPEGKITREQAAVIIGRLFKEDPGTVTPSSLSFTDRSKIADWSAGYIKAAADAGILTGYTDGSFQPTKVVTRGEVAKILYFYMGTSLSTAGKAYTGADLKSDTANVTISESCTLSDAVVKGDLYITEGLGSTAVTLTNVTVDGTILISGGTVTLMNTTSDHMIVASPMGRLLQTTATGAARIAETEVRSAATLYERGLTTSGYDGFKNIIVNGDSRVSLTLDAAVTDLTLESEATVSMTAGTAIYLLTAKKAASVTGYGSVYQANILGTGVSFASSIDVSGYELATGVAPTNGGQTVSTSSEPSVSPAGIAVDLNDLSTLGAGVAITVPAEKTITAVTGDGVGLSSSTAYTTTGEGICLLTSYLGSLNVGTHTLVLDLSDGSSATVSVVVADSGALAGATALSFDRYYLLSGFADVSTALTGVTAETQIAGVVLGLTQLEYSFNSVTRSLVLRRGVLGQLPAGIYTVIVQLTSGEAQKFTLTVSDSAPAGTTALVGEYNTYSPAELVFSLPLSGQTVKSVTLNKNGTAQTLTAGTDYSTATHSLTLTRTALEKYRVSGSTVAFTATLSNGTAYTLAVDYLK